VPAIRRSFVAIGVFGLALLGVGSPVSAAWGASTADPCAAAQRLIASDPEKALEEIEAIQELALDLIVKTEDDALRDSLAQQLADCTTAHQAAELALADEEDDESDCCADFGEKWKAFLDDCLTPLSGAALAWLAVLAALLVVTRLVMLLPAIPWRAGRYKWSVTGLRVLGGIGAALGILGAGLAVWAVTTLGLAHLVWVAFLSVAIAGTLPFAMYLAGRTRIAVKVLTAEGTSDSIGAAEIVAAISDIAATEAGGIEIPDAPDVEALKGAVLEEAPGGKLLSGALTALQGLFGLVPWQIVFAQLDDTRASLTIRRNGRVVKATTLDLNDFPPLAAAPKEPPVAPKTDAEAKTDEKPKIPDPRLEYLRKLAAGHVVTAVADQNAGFSGLFGATQGNAVGLYQIGARLYPKDDESFAIFTGALRDDPNYHLAELGVMNARFRRSTSRAELETFAGFLGRFLDSPHQNENTDRSRILRLRTLNLKIVAIRNALAAGPASVDGPTNSALLTAGAQAAVEGIGILKRKEIAARPIAPLLEMAFAISIALLTHLEGKQTKKEGTEQAAEGACVALASSKDWLERARFSVSPDIAYDYLCYLSRTSQVENQPRVDIEWRVQMNILQPEDAAYLWNDPELKELRKLEWFKKGYPKPTEDTETKPQAATKPARAKTTSQKK
jgi:hypothetical protein